MKKLLLSLVVLLLAFAGFVATRPAAFHVERSVTVQAPVATIEAQIVDFRAWNAWSPWVKLDPAMKKTFDGPATGVGAVYGWVGNDKVGEGRMTITEHEPGARVGMRLEFLKPWEATSATAFAFAPEGAATRVTWTMDGTNDFLGKLMCLFVDMDKQIGGDFERGLASLRSVSEASAAGAPADTSATP